MRRVVRLGVSTVALLFILTLILLLRTFQSATLQIEVEAVPPVELNEEELAGRLSGALQFRTISYPDPPDFDGEEFLGLHTYLEGIFPRVHGALGKEVVGEYSLLYRWTGRDPSLKPILLMSHIDVVPVETATEDQWTYPPFSGRIANGFVWGRGTLDIKSGAIAILEAVEFLLAQGFQPRHDLYVALGHDEEVGGAGGNAEIASRLAGRGVRLRFVLDEGGVIVHDVIPGVSQPVAYIATAEKGYFGLKLTTRGSGGHSSMPRPQTAVGIIAGAIHKLESHPFPADLGGATGQMLDYLGPEMPLFRRLALANRWLFAPLIKRQFADSSAMNATIRTTTAVTMVGGGVSRNVLPTTAWAVVNFRVAPGESSDQVLRYARSVINDTRVECEEHGSTSEPSRVSDVNSRDFRMLHRTVREVFPNVLVSPALAVVTTDSRHYESIAQNTFRFIPTRLGPEDLDRPHGIDERIAVDNYAEIVRFYVRLIRNSGGQ